MKHHAYTRVDRAHMRATTSTPWNAHCHVCCSRLEVCEETLLPGTVLVPQCSWWRATRDEAQAVALAHLAGHVEPS